MCHNHTSTTMERTTDQKTGHHSQQRQRQKKQQSHSDRNYNTMLLLCQSQCNGKSCSISVSFIPFFVLLLGHFWHRSNEHTKILRKLCLHFARQDGQDGKKNTKNQRTKISDEQNISGVVKVRDQYSFSRVEKLIRFMSY